MANEQRLIEAGALWSDIMMLPHNGDIISSEEVEQAIKDAPTVDARPVVHGRWLYDSGSGKHFCSACDEYALSFKRDTLYGADLYEEFLSDYCPNCGNPMDGGADNG